MTKLDSALLLFELVINSTAFCRHLPKTLGRSRDWLATAMELSHVPVRDESRHSQMQMMAAMMSATQLTPIGIW